MHILRASDYKQMPWKNGGGVTTEIAIAPADAGVGDFNWRISMAKVGADGAFSSFEEVDRILTILDGKGMDLDVAGMTPARLTAASEPFVFPGDVPTTATLVAGSITDFNVMTRRGEWTATVEKLTVQGALAVAADANANIIFCCEGSFEISDHQPALAKHDALFIEAANGIAAIAINGFADILLIRLSQNSPVS